MSEENEEYNEISDIEASAINKYIRNIYSIRVPEPKAPTPDQLSFWSIAGLEAAMFTISAFGAIAFSSIRTGGLFFITESLLITKFNLGDIVKNGFSLGSMIGSLAAFELYVAASGFRKGRENTDIQDSPVGLWSSMAVIVIAGIFSGMGLIKNLDPNLETWFYVSIAIITAFAGGVVSYFSGENVGFTFSKVDRVKNELDDAHQRRHQAWLENAMKSYATSHYNLASKKSQKFQENFKNEKDFSKSDLEFQNFFNSLSKLDQARYLVKNFFEKNGSMAVSSDITKHGVSVGYASQAINEFILENAEELMNNNKISPERYAKAQSARNTP